MNLAKHFFYVFPANSGDEGFVVSLEPDPAVIFWIFSILQFSIILFPSFILIRRCWSHCLQFLKQYPNCSFTWHSFMAFLSYEIAFNFCCIEYHPSKVIWRMCSCFNCLNYRPASKWKSFVSRIESIDWRLCSAAPGSAANIKHLLVFMWFQYQFVQTYQNV